MVEHSPSNLQISKPNASGKSSQIINSLLVVSEKLEKLLGLWVSDVEDFLFGDSRIIRAVGDGSWVVVAVEFVEVHGYVNVIIK